MPQRPGASLTGWQSPRLEFSDPGSGPSGGRGGFLEFGDAQHSMPMYLAMTPESLRSRSRRSRAPPRVMRAHPAALRAIAKGRENQAVAMPVGAHGSIVPPTPSSRTRPRPRRSCICSRPLSHQALRSNVLPPSRAAVRMHRYSSSSAVSVCTMSLGKAMTSASIHNTQSSSRSARNRSWLRARAEPPGKRPDRPPRSAVHWAAARRRGRA